MLKKLRFSLRTLLILMTLLPCLIWLVYQTGMGSAHFEILGEFVEVDADGKATGELQYRIVEMNEQSTSYGDFVLSIAPIDAPGLAKIAKGQKFKIRFRNRDMWPLKRADPHRHFITRQLGIDNEYIIGWAHMDKWTQIAIGEGKD